MICDEVPTLHVVRLAFRTAALSGDQLMCASDWCENVWEETQMLGPEAFKPSAYTSGEPHKSIGENSRPRNKAPPTPTHPPDRNADPGTPPKEFTHARKQIHTDIRRLSGLIHISTECKLHVSPSHTKHSYAPNLKKDPLDKDRGEKKCSPPRQRGYKLGVVSITMYINSHTSF